MAPDDEQQPDVETQQRIRADLDRFMQSSGLAAARDIVTENPLLLGPHVADYLGEAVKRLRQLGDVEMAEKCEFWLGLLRTFREFGVQEGYLELAINKLVRAPTSEAERAVLREYPELTSESAAAYIKRRHRESVHVADTETEGKYRLAWTLISAKSIGGLDTADNEPPSAESISSPDAQDSGMTDAVNTFLAGFILEPDIAAQRRLLESRPDLLQSPRSTIVSSMFQPYIQRARTSIQLVTLRNLLLRQALFARCQEVGVSHAYEELANGVKWKQLSSR